MEQQTPPLVPLESEPKYSFCQWFFDTSAEVGRILIPPPRECTRSVWSSAFRRPFERRSSSRVNPELQTGGGSRMRPGCTKVCCAAACQGADRTLTRIGSSTSVWSDILDVQARDLRPKLPDHAALA